MYLPTIFFPIWNNRHWHDLRAELELEARSPLLDHKCAEFAATIPPEIKLLRECGLTIVATEATLQLGIADFALSRRYRVLPEIERRTRAVHVIARKP